MEVSDPHHHWQIVKMFTFKSKSRLVTLAYQYEANHFPSHPSPGLNRGRQPTQEGGALGLLWAVFPAEAAERCGPDSASCPVRQLRAPARLPLCRAQAFLNLEDSDKVDLLPTLCIEKPSLVKIILFPGIF